MSFGRKGMPPHRAAPASGRDQNDGAPALSPELAAFLARERAAAPAQPSGLASITDRMFGAYADNKSLAARLGGRMGFKHRGERLLFIAYALWWFLSPTGAHRHYLGAHASGFAMMGLWFIGLLMAFLAFGNAEFSGVQMMLALALIVAGMLWFAIDAFLIPGMLRDCNERLRKAGGV